MAALGRGPAGPEERLFSAFLSAVDPDSRCWVERQLTSRLSQEMEDATLAHAGYPRIIRWALRKTRLADGTGPGDDHRPLSADDGGSDAHAPPGGCAALPLRPRTLSDAALDVMGAPPYRLARGAQTP